MSKIYIKNLNFETDESSLKEACASFGTVKDVRIIKETNQVTGEKRSRGFGFVTFSNQSEADDAIRNMDGTPIDGREVHVEAAIDKRQTAPRHINS